VSPDRTYRAEVYRPSLFQWLLNLDMEDPGFVRLYRNTDNHYFGESPVADLFKGAEVFWHMAISGRVVVGHDIVFEGIPPMTAWGQELALPPTGGGSGEVR
jgi:hypothetical protein